MWIENLVSSCLLFGLSHFAFGEESKPPAATSATAISTSVKADVEAPKPTVQGKNADSTCVKKQITNVLDYEKKYYASKGRYTNSAAEALIPKEVIVDCPGWNDPEIRTTYGGSGVVIRSMNPATGESWSINNEGAFVQESAPKSH
jgi:hypothetical protein